MIKINKFHFDSTDFNETTSIKLVRFSVSYPPIVQALNGQAFRSR